MDNVNAKEYFTNYEDILVILFIQIPKKPDLNEESLEKDYENLNVFEKL